MNPLNFHITDFIKIEDLCFEVSEIVERKVSENDSEKSFFSYHLKSKNLDITHAEIDYFTDSKIFFHITKKVKSTIEGKNIIINKTKYDIFSKEDGIFIDPETKEIKNVKIFKLENNFEGISPHELHITDDFEIFYFNMKIKKEDIKNE